MEKVKIGLIGCGGFANYHLGHLLEMQDAEVTALSAGNRTRLAETGARVPNARQYTDHHDMFQKESLDAVVICATPERHEDIEEICCSRMIPFYVEKPVGLSAREIVHTAGLVRESGLMTSVGYQERYNPALREVKGFLEQQPVGLAEGSWTGGMPGPLWWRTRARSGGQIVEQTTHLFDMFRNLFGEVDTVYAAGLRSAAFGGPEHDTEDCSTVVMTFECGLVATLHSASYLQNDAVGRVGFSVTTPSTRIEYAWNRTLTIISEGQTLIKNIEQNNHFTAMRNFVDAVRYDNPALIRSPYGDAAKSCLLTLAANRSMETGKAVSVPEEFPCL